MDAKKFAMGTIAGGITMFAFGFLIYGLALKGFFEANTLHPQILIDPPNFLWLVLGMLAMASFYTYILLTWAGIKTFAGGAKAGAVLGLLLGMGITFTFYGTMEFMTPTGAFVDIGVNTVSTAITCGVIAMVLGRD